MPSETGAWMPIYWADYLADTQHLTLEEHGAYLLLIATYWRRGKPLPDDDKFLSMVTKSSTKKWKMVRQKISHLFSISEGEWRHERVEKEILKSSERLKSARANGRAGGVAKSKLVTVTVTSPVPLSKERGRSTPPPERKEDDKARLYRRGREVLGKSAGGVITNLLKLYDGKAHKALAKIEDAASMREPEKWINAFLWDAKEGWGKDLIIGPM